MYSASVFAVWLYSVPLLFIALLYWRKQKRQETVSKSRLRTATASGLTEPSSLHPLIDPGLCIGCGSCVSACPEGVALGLIDRKAVLVNPADCIGHGACRRACPEDAIKLVFGTESRGVDIPELTPKFETTIPGIYVAGELGGMGLIKNAIEQGRQAMNNIAEALSDSPRKKGEWDAVIVGCGPAGISAALQAKELGLRALVIEKSKIGGTIAHFPRMKMVMTSPATLPGVGIVKFNEIQKEELIAFWQDVVQSQRPTVHESECLMSITTAKGGGFLVATDKAKYHTRKILLAMGRRGIPRKLGVPGEDLEKVVYELEDPSQYRDKRVMIVGGGNSALEAAIAVSSHSPGNVILCYRGKAFNRARPKNRDEIERLAASKAVIVRYSTVVAGIGKRFVVTECKSRKAKIPNDQIIICAGGILPTGFLKETGIEVVTKHGET